MPLIIHIPDHISYTYIHIYIHIYIYLAINNQFWEVPIFLCWEKEIWLKMSLQHCTTVAPISPESRLIWGNLFINKNINQIICTTINYNYHSLVQLALLVSPSSRSQQHNIQVVVAKFSSKFMLWTPCSGTDVEQAVLVWGRIITGILQCCNLHLLLILHCTDRHSWGTSIDFMHH